MNGKRAKQLRKLAKHDVQKKAMFKDIENGKQRVLRINQDGSTEEILKTSSQIERDDTKKTYKRYKKIYKELKKGGL